MPQIDLGNAQWNSFDALVYGNHIFIVYSTAEQTSISILYPHSGALFHRAFLPERLDELYLSICMHGLIISGLAKSTNQQMRDIFCVGKNICLGPKVNQMC